MHKKLGKLIMRLTRFACTILLYLWKKIFGQLFVNTPKYYPKDKV